ncbi:MAG: hypothetical protein SW833_00685 [Cyanobacteriota bacterium]|nr:hypothetical protein [Cyanobacteriota bacterium]
MTDIWLVLTSPYAYERALRRANNVAKRRNAKLHTVFFIERDAASEMVRELSTTGWLGPGSLRNLQTSISEGYRSLADDVLERVQRKAKSVAVVCEGVLEEPSLAVYLDRLLQQGVTRLIISGSKPLELATQSSTAKIEWIEDD